MKLGLLIFILIFLPSNVFAAAENGYQAILDSNLTQLKEQSLKKGEEFIQANTELDDLDLNYRQYDIRNEFHESIKLIFKDSRGLNFKELYLNAYQNIEKVAIPKDIDFTVHVINVYGQNLGILRKTTINNNKINVSPFMLVQKYNFKQPKIQVIEQQKVELILQQEPHRPEVQTQKIIEQEIQIVEPERSIKVANISSSTVHIDILESNNKKIGAGWTIPNDIYEAQFLDFKKVPVKISTQAQLILKIAGTEKKRLNAKDLTLDPHGNYIWFITDPL